LYQEGDVVRVRTREELLAHGGIQLAGRHIEMPDGMHMVSQMFGLCGKTVTIHHVVESSYASYYTLEEGDGYSWSDALFSQTNKTILKELYA